MGKRMVLHFSTTTHRSERLAGARVALGQRTAQYGTLGVTYAENVKETIPTQKRKGLE